MWFTIKKNVIEENHDLIINVVTKGMTLKVVYLNAIFKKLGSLSV